ncbi:hypothetical protein AAHE18_19G164000 [Arachis hypogaea]
MLDHLPTFQVRQFQLYNYSQTNEKIKKTKEKKIYKKKITVLHSYLITPTFPSLNESCRTFSLASCLSAFETDISKSDIIFVRCKIEGTNVNLMHDKRKAHC